MNNSTLRWYWGSGGYYQVEIAPDGAESVPAGRAAWERFIQFAPAEKLAAAYRALLERQQRGQHE